MCHDQKKITSLIIDLGPARYLNIEFLPHPNGSVLSQSHYIHALLKRSNMDKSKPIATPWPVSSLSNNHVGSFESSIYRSVIGALQYITIPRLDTAFAVKKECQTMYAPSAQDWVNLKHKLRDLKRSIPHGTLLQHILSLSLTAFSDADWAGSPSARQSTEGYLIFLGTNLISWSSKKEPTVALSSAEVEYIAVAGTIAELLWICSLLTELRIPFASPTTQ